MGGNPDKFSDLCMYDFQIHLEAYKTSSGYQEPTIKDTDDLDELYSQITPELLQ